MDSLNISQRIKTAKHFHICNLRTRHVAKHNNKTDDGKYYGRILFVLDIMKKHRSGTCDIHNRLK